MKLSVAFVLLSAAILAGCTRPVVRETIVERPVVQPAAGATSPPSCTYASQAYSHGSVSCQDRAQYRCDNGVWNRTFNAC